MRFYLECTCKLYLGRQIHDKAERDRKRSDDDSDLKVGRKAVPEPALQIFLPEDNKSVYDVTYDGNSADGRSGSTEGEGARERVGDNDGKGSAHGEDGGKNESDSQHKLSQKNDADLWALATEEVRT